jgi:hypothetical protein
MCGYCFFCYEVMTKPRLISRRGFFLLYRSVEAKMTFEHLGPDRPSRPGFAVSAFFVVPALSRVRGWAITPTVVGLVGINPTFPERVDHRVRVARSSTAAAATAEWRVGRWIHKLGPGGAQHRHRRDDKRETGSDCEIAHLFPPMSLPDIKEI